MDNLRISAGNHETISGVPISIHTDIIYHAGTSKDRKSCIGFQGVSLVRFSISVKSLSLSWLFADAWLRVFTWHRALWNAHVGCSGSSALSWQLLHWRGRPQSWE